MRAFALTLVSLLVVTANMPVAWADEGPTSLTLSMPAGPFVVGETALLHASVRSANGSPLAGEAVTFDGVTRVTGPSGNVTFEATRTGPGHFPLRVSTASTSAEVTRIWRAPVLSFDLPTGAQAPIVANAIINMRWSPGGAPANAVEVGIQAPDGFHITRSDAAGRATFVLNERSGGTRSYDLVFDDPRLAAWNQAFTIAWTKRNLPPVLDNVTVEIDGKFATAILTGLRDPENDPITVAYKWARNADVSESSSPRIAIEPGDEVRVEVTPRDDTSIGAAVLSEPTLAPPDQLPRAVIRVSGDTIVGAPLTFDGGSSSDAEGPLTTWRWRFDNTTPRSGSTLTHTFATAGEHAVDLTVTDSHGQTATASIVLVVREAAAPVVPFSFVDAAGTNWTLNDSSSDNTHLVRILDASAPSLLIRRPSGLSLWRPSDEVLTSVSEVDATVDGTRYQPGRLLTNITPATDDLALIEVPDSQPGRRVVTVTGPSVNAWWRESSTIFVLGSGPATVVHEGQALAIGLTVAGPDNGTYTATAVASSSAPITGFSLRLGDITLASGDGNRLQTQFRLAETLTLEAVVEDAAGSRVEERRLMSHGVSAPSDDSEAGRTETAVGNASADNNGADGNTTSGSPDATTGESPNTPADGPATPAAADAAASGDVGRAGGGDSLPGNRTGATGNDSILAGADVPAIPLWAGLVGVLGVAICVRRRPNA